MERTTATITRLFDGLRLTVANVLNDTSTERTTATITRLFDGLRLTVANVLPVAGNWTTPRIKAALLWQSGTIRFQSLLADEQTLATFLIRVQEVGKLFHKFKVTIDVESPVCHSFGPLVISSAIRDEELTMFGELILEASTSLDNILTPSGAKG